jgi:hypothetical protein
LPLGIVTVASIALAAVAHLVLIRPVNDTSPEGEPDPGRTADTIHQPATAPA